MWHRCGILRPYPESARSRRSRRESACPSREKSRSRRRFRWRRARRSRWRVVWFRRRWGMPIPSRTVVAPTGGGVAGGVGRVRPGKFGGPVAVACLPRPPLGRLLLRLLRARVRPGRRITAVTAGAVPAVVRTGVPARGIVALVRIRRIGGRAAGAFPRPRLLLGIRHVHPVNCITAVTAVAAPVVVRMGELVPATVSRVRLVRDIIVLIAGAVLVAVRMGGLVPAIAGRVRLVSLTIVLMAVAVRATV